VEKETAELQAAKEMEVQLRAQKRREMFLQQQEQEKATMAVAAPLADLSAGASSVFRTDGERSAYALQVLSAGGGGSSSNSRKTGAGGKKGKKYDRATTGVSDKSLIEDMFS
jgi:hypothetical protein